MNEHTVAVVGLGATGAFVARAAYDLGYKVSVYVAGTANTTPPGAFWLHWLPDDVTEQFKAKPIRIIGKGTEAEYVMLQWGKHQEGKTIKFSSSFPKSPVTEQGYNPQEVLPHLVPAEVMIENVPFPLSDADVQDLAYSYEFVFQTFPRKEDIETQPTRIPFIAAARWSTEDPDKNVVVYNGTGNGIVVREAMLFGNRFLEFPKGMSLSTVKGAYDLSGFHTVELKDLAPNSTPMQIFGKRVYLMGRYAQWDRRCLSHDCYSRTIAILTGYGQNG